MILEVHDDPSDFTISVEICVVMWPTRTKPGICRLAVCFPVGLLKYDNCCLVVEV